MNEYLKVIRDNYANFNGRARRKEYWMFTLFHFLIIIALFILASVFESQWIAIIVVIYYLATIIPRIAVTIRRMHDVDKSGSGWWILIAFIPLVGIIWLIVLLATDGTRNDNEYGASPKYGSNEFDELGNN